MYSRCNGPASSQWRALVWRPLSAAILIAVLGFATVSGVWHVGHEADQDCAVCQLRHQPTADLAVAPTIALPEGTSSVGEFLRTRLVEQGRFAVPARAPPLS